MELKNYSPYKLSIWILFIARVILLSSDSCRILIQKQHSEPMCSWKVLNWSSRYVLLLPIWYLL